MKSWLKGLLRDLAEQALTSALERLWEVDADDGWPPTDVSLMEGIGLEEPQGIVDMPEPDADMYLTVWTSRHVERDSGWDDLLEELLVHSVRARTEAQAGDFEEAEYYVRGEKAARVQCQMVAMGILPWWEE